MPVNSGAAPRTFTSAFNPSVQFQFADYGSAAARNNNFLPVPAGQSGTMTLAAPGKFQSVQFLDTAQGVNAGVGTAWNATLNFADGSHTVVSVANEPDWTNGGNNALLNTGLVNGGGYYNGSLNLFEHDFTLAAADQAKTLASVTFNTTSSTGNGLAFFAMSGQVLSASGTLSPAQSYSNAITIAADSTIDVQNSLAATVGTVSIGSNQLSVSGTAGANLNLGAVTLTGTPTFNPAVNTTVTPGAISGSFGINKTGAGTLVLNANNTYTGSTTISQGRVAVVRTIGATPLSSGPVVLAGGTLALTGVQTLTQSAVPLTGYNQDIIWGNGESATPGGGTTTPFSGMELVRAGHLRPLAGFTG